MTTGQQLIEQGRQQGIAQSRQRLQELSLYLLRQRLGDEVNAHIERRDASVEQIETWTTPCLRPPRSPSYSPTEIQRSVS